MTPEEFERLRKQRQLTRIAEIQSEIRGNVRAGCYRPHFADDARDQPTGPRTQLWRNLYDVNVKA